MQAAPSWPLAAIRQQLARSIDVIVHVGRTRACPGRHITSIDEVGSDATGGPSVRQIATSVDGDLTRVDAFERVR